MFCASFEWLWSSNCLLVPLEQTERQRQRHQKSGVQSLIGCLFVSPEWHRRENLIPINADGLMVQLTVNIVNIVFDDDDDDHDDEEEHDDDENHNDDGTDS